MTIADRAVLVTGANRGIGQALVAEALSRGAKRVYAATRQPLAHPDGYVTPLTLDVTNAAQGQAAAERVASTAPRHEPPRHLRCHSGLPAITDPFSGAIANVL
jgi:NAD(P)-dependent dehydrogenase (short-subunit alcohol dehydrogenase family)